jgi:outer membrane protein assembly factor BamB
MVHEISRSGNGGTGMSQTLFRYRAILFLGLACLIAGCTGSTNPPAGTYDSFVAANGTMFGLDAAHTHFNPYEHILNSANVSRLVPAWAYPSVGVIGTSPVVANGIVYFGSVDKSLYALDAHSGSKLWSFATQAGIDSSPTKANGVVYVGSRDSFLYALDARSGSKLWSFALGSFIESSPAIADGMVYVGSGDGKVYAFRLPG